MRQTLEINPTVASSLNLTLKLVNQRSYLLSIGRWMQQGTSQIFLQDYLLMRTAIWHLQLLIHQGMPRTTSKNQLVKGSIYAKQITSRDPVFL